MCQSLWYWSSLQVTATLPGGSRKFTAVFLRNLLRSTGVGKGCFQPDLNRGPHMFQTMCICSRRWGVVLGVVGVGHYNYNSVDMHDHRFSNCILNGTWLFVEKKNPFRSNLPHFPYVKGCNRQKMTLWLTKMTLFLENGHFFTLNHKSKIAVVPKNNHFSCFPGHAFVHIVYMSAWSPWIESLPQAAILCLQRAPVNDLIGLKVFSQFFPVRWSKIRFSWG